MRWISGLAVVLALFVCAESAIADYVVLSGVGKDDPYHGAARLLAAHHETKHVLRFDPEKPDGVLAKLREIAPTHVAIVMRPEQIHVNSVRRILKMSTRIDADPFVDFDYGYVTGATASEAKRFVKNLVAAKGRSLPRVVGRAVVGGGSGPSVANKSTYDLGSLHLPLRELRFIAPKGTHGRDQAFIDKHLDDLEGCGAIIMGGHGMPWEIGSGPRAEDVDKLDLFPAVAFNYACYTGVTRTWPEREYRGATYRLNLKEVEAKRSFALAMIRRGVVAYVAYVNPRPAGPELSVDFQCMLAGSSLGAVRRNDYAKIVLGYLGFGEPGITVGDWPDGAEVERAKVHPVRHKMLEGSTGGILYGDPAYRPYKPQDGVLPLATTVERKGEHLHVTLKLGRKWAYIWGSDPFRQFDPSTRTMAMKVYDRVEVPKGFEVIRSVRIESATMGGKPLTTLPVVWGLEEDQGKRYLHVKANFARGGSGDIVVHFVAGPEAPPPDLTRKGACLDYARQVGEHLLAHLDDVEEANVYGGAAGVALFFFDLHAATKEKRWLKPARKLLDRAAKDVEGDGLYTGAAGVGQVALDAWHHTDDDALLKKARKIAKGLGQPHAYDVISGAAGAGIFLLNLHAATGEKRHLERAEALGRHLVEDAVVAEGHASWPVSPDVDRYYLGFSHGAAGIGYFLLHLHLATGEPEFLTCAEQAARWVMKHAVDDGAGGWKWPKMQPRKKDAYPVQWCHGSPGIGLFFLALDQALVGSPYGQALARCVAADRRTGRTARVGGCQCHGISGNAELLIEVHRATKDPGLLADAQRWGLDLVDADGVKTSLGDYTYDPSYMTGLAGIGRFFVRLADPQGVHLPFMVRTLERVENPALERVRVVSRRAVDPRQDIEADLAELAKLGRPAFDAILELIATGQGHWRTHVLLKATWQDGGERRLMALADGPSLPGHGRWTALTGLGAADLPAVRTYLLARIAKERDAGLFMSAAKALGMLAEKRGADAVARQLLRFEQGWSGVEVHLLAALTRMGGEKLTDHLRAFLLDERAVRGPSVSRALSHLGEHDRDTALEAARALRASPRYEGFDARLKEKIERLASR